MGVRAGRDFAFGRVHGNKKKTIHNRDTPTSPQRRLSIHVCCPVSLRSRFPASTVANLLLHETLSGGFSPTAVLKLRRLARKAARGSVDRTAYSPKYSLSFMSHHAERISLSHARPSMGWTTR